MHKPKKGLQLFQPVWIFIIPEMSWDFFAASVSWQFSILEGKNDSKVYQCILQDNVRIVVEAQSWEMQQDNESLIINDFTKTKFVEWHSQNLDINLAEML